MKTYTEKDLTLFTLIVVVVFHSLLLWLSLNLVPFIFGLVDGFSKNESCHDSLARIEYVFPGHQFGCWLGEKR